MLPRLLLIVLLCFLGCSEARVNVRALPKPPKEIPPVNLPAGLHKENWLGKLQQGSCVHASMTNHLRSLNLFEKGELWRSRYEDGEYDSRLEKRLRDEGIKFVSTRNADPRFMDWASSTRRGAIMWWKPSHCCFFCGWVERDGKQYAAVLDPNRPGIFELTERSQFIRLWAGYGGYACTVVSPPLSSVTWQSYEVY